MKAPKTSVFLLVLCCTGLLGALLSCNPQPHAPKLLAEAERLMESRPDSAMRFIDSIFYPEKSLRKHQLMQYRVARVQARYKNYRPIAEDTLIFAAKDYFAARNKNPEQTALACFYAGCVYREQGNFDRAMQLYKQAEGYAAQTADVDLMGLIAYNLGDLLAEQGLEAQALEKYAQAKRFYAQSPDKPKEKEARCEIAVGQMFLLSKNSDAALEAFHKGLELAEMSGNTDAQSTLYQNIGVAYKETGNYAAAENHFRRAFLLEKDTTELPRYYLNLAQLYTQTNQPDSAVFYTALLKQSVQQLNDPYFKAAAYGFLAENARENGDYDAAFKYLKQSSDLVEEITEKRLQQSVYEVHQKYDFNKAQERHYRQLSTYKSWLIVLLAALLVVGSLFAWHFIRQKNKRLNMYQTIDTLQQMATELEQEGIVQGKEITEKQREIERLQRQIANAAHSKEQEATLLQNTRELMALYTRNNRKKSETLRSLLLWQLGVVSKVAELNKLEKNVSGNELFSGIQKVLFKGDFADRDALILSVFNRFDNQLVEKVQLRIPQLNPQELQVCLLTYAGMSVKEIAALLPISPHTIQSYRGNVRKYLHIADTDGTYIDTATHLRNLLDS